jgi:hypothetical protein
MFLTSPLIEQAITRFDGDFERKGDVTPGDKGGSATIGGA